MPSLAVVAFRESERRMIGRMSPEYEDQDWFGLYGEAMIELEHAQMTGRIGAARSAITARIEKLRSMPGLHTVEYQAIEDALSGLRMLEREDVSYQAEEKLVAEQVLQNLKVLEPKFLKSSDPA